MNIYICDINDFDISDGYELLTEERKNKLNDYKRIDDKKRVLVSGLLLKYILQDKICDLKYNEYGKPYIEDSNLHFNISHSGHYCIIGVSTSNIGIDIEEKKPFYENAIHRCLNELEIEYYNNNKSLLTFYKIWTAKESIIKTLGKTIYNNIKEITSLPLTNGYYTFKDEKYYLEWIDKDNYVICVCLKEEDEINIKSFTKYELLKKCTT